MSDDERDKWEDKYSGSIEEESPDSFYLKCVEQLPVGGGTAIDIASGTGRHAVDLVNRKYSVKAVDISPTALKILSSRISQESIETFCTDLEFETPESTQVDLIVNILFLHRNCIKWIKESVRPGGYIIFKALAGGENKNGFRLIKGELAVLFDDWEVMDSETVDGEHATDAIFVRKPPAN